MGAEDFDCFEGEEEVKKNVLFLLEKERPDSGLSKYIEKKKRGRGSELFLARLKTRLSLCYLFILYFGSELFLARLKTRLSLCYLFILYFVIY
ncbi:hypothetical protein QJS04_geneDACA014650 [Acorus gramineus]|uniref:Uncharacterized protein n=1 Tax=Acorus gramineus TaxID=55184 RepID=A0AAV9B754_ACOGR|nr:hypothetical protein QJS04_geneDACA014650 [Acorus gramineus]